jgi:DNA-binding MarR family transcriptional regulator
MFLRMICFMGATRQGRTSAPRPTAGQIDAMVRASRVFVGMAAASLAELDDAVTVPQLRVLVMVHTRGPLNLSAVAAALEVNPSNASRTCDRLIRAGLLDRREAPEDRRNLTLTLTDEGRRLVEKLTRQRRNAIERVLRKMEVSDREQLSEALDKFATAAGEPADDSVTLIWHPAR